MKCRYFLILMLSLLLCSVLVGCFDTQRGVYDLGLETNFGTKLPEDGTVLYKIFAPLGKDAMEYAAIEYTDTSVITEHFPWKTMDDNAWTGINRVIDYVEYYISKNGEEPIPSHLMPDPDMLYFTIGDFPSIENPYVFFVLSPSDMRVYVLISLP